MTLRRESKSLWRSLALCNFALTTACALRGTPVGVSTEITTAGRSVRYLELSETALRPARLKASLSVDVYDEGDAWFDAVRVRELLRSGMSPQAVIADSSDDRISVAFLRDDLLVISNHDHPLPPSGVAIWVIRI